MIKAAGVIWLFLVLLAGGAMLSGNYQLRTFDRVLNRVLRATFEERDGRLHLPVAPARIAEPA